MNLRWIGLLPIAFLLAACSGNDEPQLSMEEVNVEILLPEKILPQELTPLQIKVTQGDENVEDANEVEFEIWQNEERENGELISAPHKNEGVYEIEYTFTEDGVFFLQPHVTARGMHVMPKEHFPVGDVTQEELNAIVDADDDADSMKEHHQEHDEEHDEEQ